MSQSLDCVDSGIRTTSSAFILNRITEGVVARACSKALVVSDNSPEGTEHRRALRPSIQPGDSPYNCRSMRRPFERHNASLITLGNCWRVYDVRTLNKRAKEPRQESELICACVFCLCAWTRTSSPCAYVLRLSPVAALDVSGLQQNESCGDYKARKDYLKCKSNR